MRTARHPVSSCIALSAALFTASLALPGSASAQPEPLAGAGAGLSAPAAVVDTPDGGIWVADPNRGVCRVDLGPQPALVDSPWCAPGVEDSDLEDYEDDEDGDDEDDELEPADPGREGRAGPADPSGLAFDERTDNFYASDRSSSGGAIWRLHFDRATGEIDDGELIASTGDRVAAMTLGPASGSMGRQDVFFVTKRESAIMRLADPALDPQPPVPTGAAIDGEVFSMTATDDALYVAAGGLVRYRLTPSGLSAPEPVAGLDGASVTAVAADASRRRLYAGTSNPSLEDDIVAIDLATDRVETYEQGFTGVTAIGVGKDGRLLAADDPLVATGAEGTLGAGRLWRVALQPLNRPAARITAGPSATSSASAVSISYASRDGASFECRLDDEVFADCPGEGSGERSYSDLPEGTHRFWVRAKDTLTGLPASRTFRLDRTAPRVTVMAPDGDFVEAGPAPRVRFSVDEPGVTYRCSLDGGPYEECWSGNPLENLAAGIHVLRVVGTDAAGNASDASAETASATIRIRPRTRPPAFPRPSESSAEATAPGSGPTEHRAPGSPPAASTPARPGSADGDAAGPGVADPGRQAGAAPERGPHLRPFTLRFRSRANTAPARLRFGVSAPQGATSLHVSIADGRGRTILMRTLTVRPDARSRVNMRLTRAEQRRLKPARYLVTAVLRTVRGTPGNAQTHWLRIASDHRP
jgi:hypothetical protein